MPKNPDPIRLTEARIRGLKAAPSGKRLRYRDTLQTGLCLRVTDGGAKSFKLYRKVAGRVVEISLGGWPSISVDQARKLAVKHLADLAAGVDVQAKKRALREEATLGDLFKDYIAYHAKPHKRTWEDDVSRFNTHLANWSNRRLSAINPADVQKWHARIGRESGQFAANRAHSLLRKMFNCARMRGWKGGNPAVGVQRFRERSRERFMDADELRHFFAALHAEPERTAQHFFLLALLTGARRANVLGMRWEDIDLQRGLWRIPGEKSKSGEPLVVILAPKVVDLLKARKEMVGDSPWVLPSAGSKSGHFTEPKMAWQRILARTELSRLAYMIAHHEGEALPAIDGVLQDAENEVLQLRLQALGRHLPRGTDPVALVLERYRKRAQALKLDPSTARVANLRIHDLRRTLGSWQAAHGASLSIIGRSLGHRQVQTTAVYARLNLDSVRTSVEKATAAMLAGSSLESPRPSHETH